VLQDRLSHLEEGGLRAAGHLLDHLRRVAAEVAFHQLEDAAWVPECLVTQRSGLPKRTHHRLERLSWTGLPRGLFPTRGRILFTAARLPRLLMVAVVLPRIGLVASEKAVVLPSCVILVFHEPGKHAI